MTMERGEQEMEMNPDTYFYDEQLCKILHLPVHVLLKEEFLKTKPNQTKKKQAKTPYRLLHMFSFSG